MAGELQPSGYRQERGRGRDKPWERALFEVPDRAECQGSTEQTPAPHTTSCADTPAIRSKRKGCPGVSPALEQQLIKEPSDMQEPCHGSGEVPEV